MNARWGEKYRAKLDEPPAHAPDYKLLSSFTFTHPGGYRGTTIAIYHNEPLGTYIWRRTILTGKVKGQLAWMDCLTTYQGIGDVLTDIAQYCYDVAVNSARWAVLLKKEVNT